jgi:hypothetical protein
MIDITKKYQTRDGVAVRILCTDGPGADYPVIGFVEGNRTTFEWNREGKYYPDKDLNSGKDLIEVREKLVVKAWINIIRVNDFPHIYVHLTEILAKTQAEKYRDTVLLEAEPYVREL